MIHVKGSSVVPLTVCLLRQGPCKALVHPLSVRLWLHSLEKKPPKLLKRKFTSFTSIFPGAVENVFLFPPEILSALTGPLVHPPIVRLL